MSLLQAVLKGDLERVRALIEAGADLNSPSSLGTPLQMAAAQGDLAMVELLLASGAELDGGNSLDSPLRAAIEKGQPAVALELLSRGARPVLVRKPSRCAQLNLECHSGPELEDGFSFDADPSPQSPAVSR